jgi:hypothetical protein
MEPDQRRSRILEAIVAELRRQGRLDPRDIDVDAMARAVHEALERPAVEDVDSLSREPDELNAANDV